MKKKQIIVLGVVLGLALVGLIIMQARYFQTAFKLKKAQFDYAVNRSLDEVVACIEERDNLNEIKKGTEKLQETEVGNKIRLCGRRTRRAIERPGGYGGQSCFESAGQ